MTLVWSARVLVVASTKNQIPQDHYLMLLVDSVATWPPSTPSSSPSNPVSTHSTHRGRNLLFPAGREFFEVSGSSILSRDVLCAINVRWVSLSADNNGQQS